MNTIINEIKLLTCNIMPCRAPMECYSKLDDFSINPQKIEIMQSSFSDHFIMKWDFNIKIWTNAQINLEC